MTSEFSMHKTPEGVAVVQPPPRLNMVAAPKLTETIAEIVSGGDNRIVVDLSRTEFVDSSGLGALVSCLKKARQAGGDLRLANAGPQMQMILELTNLQRVMQPAATVDDAISGL